MNALGAIAVGNLVDGNTHLRAQLAGVSDVAWTKFVHALTVRDERGAGQGKPRAFDARSSTGLGCFAIRPLRLADLGMMRNIRRVQLQWTGDFIAPMSTAKFLLAPLVQYNTLLDSLQRYDRELAVLATDNMTRSGALALLHRLGPHAFAKWDQHKEPTTSALFQRANGLF